MEVTGDLRRHDFSGQDLTGALFRDADLCRASFAGANLADALFLNCFAAEASFENANCAGLQASETNFYRTDFRGRPCAKRFSCAACWPARTCAARI